ncbi:hypothetical protein Trco_001635 [Trichoderma cornu-damae]|uniref:Epoxide hydrolase N-terminal domain-containing protein n=1 Tax=Trichoderma cornu-damae TaxID=654480 RepID=A0A9P8QSP9_9HYPO|nr:hypothetical protein Trco_001635 [Trichoderma cornu-damae]
MRCLSIRSIICLTAAFLSPVLARSHGQSPHYQPRPYKIDVSPAFIDEIRFKAAHYHPTVGISAPAWFDGPPTADISQIAKYIASDYDWFAFQEAVNTNFSHYTITIPAVGSSYPHDLDLHFIHQKSEREDAIPIILLHGWPSTSLEWEKIIRPLANPQDSSKPAFHVVAPDLPGYGFSPAPISPLGAPEYAAVCASLMQQLGYEKYALYSTDLGFVVAVYMIDQFEERILNHVTDYYLVPPNATDLERLTRNQTTAEESRYISSLSEFRANFSAYSSVHATFPLSVAYALNDSPVGFLAWMWQLDYLVRDSSVPYSVEELVSQAMTLFVPGVYGNIRSYKELLGTIFSERKASGVRTSVTQWGYPKPTYPVVTSLNFVPRDWVERSANLTFFRRHESGGHFPAYTRPETWLEDIWDIFAFAAE